MNILQVMSDLGGLVRIIFFVATLVCHEINYYNFIAKMIRGRFYENLCANESADLEGFCIT